MATDKTIRNGTQWIKIIRDNQNRTFTFARGYVGESQAHHIDTWGFELVKTWQEAIEKAEEKMQIYS